MNHTTLQRRFAARIRDPQQALPPGIATERMAIYEELFFKAVPLDRKSVV